MVGTAIDMLNLEALVLILQPFLKTKGFQQTIGEKFFLHEKKIEWRLTFALPKLGLIDIDFFFSLKIDKIPNLEDPA